LRRFLGKLEGEIGLRNFDTDMQQQQQQQLLQEEVRPLYGRSTPPAPPPNLTLTLT
jgi:hypothetical protein